MFDEKKDINLENKADKPEQVSSANSNSNEDKVGVSSVQNSNPEENQAKEEDPNRFLTLDEPVCDTIVTMINY